MPGLKADDAKLLLDKLEKYINDVKYGSITIVIQDGKVVQIEKNEKVRLR